MPDENYGHALYDVDCIVVQLVCAKEKNGSYGSGTTTWMSVHVHGTICHYGTLIQIRELIGFLV